MTVEIEYKDGEWPEVVILMLTWSGPPELGIAEHRLSHTKKTIEHLKRNFGYPNYSWHIADDGSPEEYQQKVLALLEGERYTFTDTKKGWDINNNWNTGMAVAFGRADIVAFWPDDRFLTRGLNVRACVRLLMSYDDVCCIRLNGGEPGLRGTPISRAGANWQLLDKKSPCTHVLLFGPAVRHRRFVEHYGYFEPDLWPLDKAENRTNTHFCHTEGPGIVCPQEFWGGFMPWGGYSTWELPKGGPFRKKPPERKVQVPVPVQEEATIDPVRVEETGVSPEVVILLKTWQGPRERNVARNRLESAKRMLRSIKKYLQYPTYSWHIADDGSEKWYQDEVLALFQGENYTFTTSGANGDIGRNLNIGMRAALQRSDHILHWSDDIVLERQMDLGPYVGLLECEDLGIIRLRALNARLQTEPREGCHVVLPASSNPFLVGTSLNLMHRRAWDFYGPYPEGLRIDYMQKEMAWRYRTFEGGPQIVIPNDLLHAVEPLCVGASTWDWRNKNEQEDKQWHRYRSYGARHE